jgi:Secretion system C-terminal sorting domain
MMNFCTTRIYLCFFLLMIFSSGHLCSQTLERNVISSSGTAVSTGGLIVSYNVGEAIVFTGSNATAILTQGFEQPEEAPLTIRNFPNTVMEVTAFPNPVTDLVYIHVNDTLLVSDYQMEVIDVVGKKIKSPSFTSLSNDTFSIDLSDLASGIYFFNVISFSNHINTTFKIIKK